MFLAAAATRLAPVTTAVFSTPAAKVDLSTYLEDYKASDLNTKATVGSMIVFIAKKARETASGGDDANDKLIAACKNTFFGDAAREIVELHAVDPSDPVTENDTIIDAITLNLPNVSGWLQDLINASKKKPLTDSNVEGYFAMLGHTGTKPSAVASIINKLAPFFPDCISDTGFRRMLTEGIWTTYRNTRVSTGLILQTLLPDFRVLCITTAGDQVEQDIIACAEAPWDLNLSLKIPNKVKAYGCIFLEAAGIPIDNWYQGNKARDELPAVKVRGAKEIFRRYLEIKNDTAGLSAIHAIGDFASSTVKDFF